MQELYRESSKRTTQGAILIAFFLLAVAGFFIFTLMRSLQGGHLIIDELFIEVVLFIVILKQALGRYTYILTDKAFVIKEQGLFRKKDFIIPYDDIDGIYSFKQELLPKLRYRYKWRKLSSMDARPVWALAYAIVKGKKIQHGRVLIKAEQGFFDALRQFIPDRIQVSEEEVVFYAYVREDAVKHGEDVKAYAKKIKEQTGQVNPVEQEGYKDSKVE